MARLRTPAASLQCNNLTMFQLYLQKTQESILQQLMSEGLLSDTEYETTRGRILANL